MTNKIYISWEEFHQDTVKLCNKIKADGLEFDKIIAVSRGGLIPAGIIAYELDIRNTETINMSSYDGNVARDDSEIELDQYIGEVNEKTIVVDDLSDSGRTFKILKNILPKATFATIYAKEKSLSHVDLFEKNMPDEWIVFPWD